jgi:hypothetical protein
MLFVPPIPVLLKVPEVPPIGVMTKVPAFVKKPVPELTCAVKVLSWSDEGAKLLVPELPPWGPEPSSLQAVNVAIVPSVIINMIKFFMDPFAGVPSLE